MDENISDISRLIEKFSENSSKPELFLSAQSTAAGNFKESTKHLYDLTKSKEEKQNDTALPELIIQGFDDEQVWQELELQNEPVISQLLTGISRLAAKGSLSLSDKERQSQKPSKKEEHDDTWESGEDSDQMEEEDAEADESDTDEDIAALMKSTDKDSYNSDESEEEKYLKDLLDKASKEQIDGDNEPADLEDEDLEAEDQDLVSESDSLEELDKFFKDSNKQKLNKGRVKEEVQKTIEVFGKSGSIQNKHKRKTVVDDKFFSLADMEEFLEEEDRREERKIAAEKGDNKRKKADDAEESESDTDERQVLDMLYEESSSDSDDNQDMKSGRDIKYEDFFGPRSGQQSVERDEEESADEVDSDEEDMIDIKESVSDDIGGKQSSRSDLFEQSGSEGEDVQDVIGGTKSTFQKRQEKLSEKIQGMEEMALEEKPWQLMGEIVAAARPVNSLLEEDLEFEQQTKTAPAITEETTKSLEEIIKQRIKDKVFDDVARKDKPKEEAFEYKKRILLDQEKSKKSLGQVYEEEYLRQTQEEADEKEDPQREEIRKMMQSLFLKLDALSNFHYTPKQAAPEVQIINNMPSITMEEVQPVSVSDAALLAPEEIKDKEKRELKGSTEKTKTDRDRERKDKKIRQRKKKLARERKQQVLEKIAPALGNKYAKERAMKELEKQSKMGKGVSVIKEKKNTKKSGLTSSKQFFSQLQDEVTTHIQAKKAVKLKKEKKRHSASKLKL